MRWKSNSGYAVLAAGTMLVVVVALAQIFPQWGSFLLLCSAGSILPLAFSAMHWVVRENSREKIVVPAALGIVLIYGALLCLNTPNQPRTLTFDELNTIRIGIRFEDIAREVGGGDWVPDAEYFTVAYDVEGNMQLVLVFENGIHLSGATLCRPDETTVTLDSTSPQGLSTHNQ